MKTLSNRRFSRGAALTAAALSACFVLGSCAGAESPTGNTAEASGQEPSGQEVSIKGIEYIPGDVTVGVGETVTWVNNDPVDHTVTSGKPGKQGVPGVSEGTEPKLDGLFDEPLAEEGSTTSFTFDKAGTYVYFCRVHAAMKAVVTVE